MSCRWKTEIVSLPYNDSKNCLLFHLEYATPKEESCNKEQIMKIEEISRAGKCKKLHKV